MLGLRKLNSLLPKFKFSTFQPQTEVNLKNQYQKLWIICKPEIKKYMFCGVITVLHAATFMYLPNIYEDITYLMSLKISEVPKQIIWETYGWKVAKWAGVFGALGSLTYLRRYEFLDVSNRISVRFRTVLYDHILMRDFYKQNQFSQTYVHHLVTDVKSISEFTGQTLFMGVRGICFLAGGIGCLLYYSPYLSLISVGIMAMFNLLFRRRNTILKLLKERQNRSLIEISQFVSQKFQSIRLIKISNTEVYEDYKFAQQLKKFYDYSKQVSRANGINYSYLEGFGLFSLFSVAACGALLISLQITNFSLIASSTYAIYVAMGFRSIISFNTQLMKMMAIYAIIQQKIGSIHTEELYHRPFIDQTMVQYQQRMKELQNQKYQVRSTGIPIEIRNLKFSYLKQGQTDKYVEIYANFNLKIKSGSIVALVGPSGSGKSTLFNLLTKLSQAQNGQIYLDEQNISNLAFKDIQKLVSYVTQENYLFKGTVAENLKYGNQGFDCSQERLIDCLKLTNAFDFIQKKGGINSEIKQKGSNLSGGQKQRLILARALVKHPRLLLLDEGTSGIDSESEKIIINNLKQHRSEMTTILISHKLEPFQSIITDIIRLKE